MIELVDKAVRSKALVLGTPPPEGRDLDLLVRSADAGPLIGALRSNGFEEVGGRWMRFAGCEVEVVDVEVVESWGLPGDEVSTMFDLASGVDGTSRLGRPDPVSTALIEARRWQNGGLLTDKRRARVQGVDWGAVERRAAAWGVAEALPVLRGEAPRQEQARVWRRRAGRRPGVVITFSGVDGSGKSSQAAALESTLRRMGYDVAAVWTRITINKSVEALGKVAPNPGRMRQFRQRWAAVNFVWISYVALVNAVAVRRATAAHLLRGRVVICDRYTLDSAAHLRYKYGAESRFRFQARLIRWVAPRPLRSYFLDVPGSTALGRKNEKYTPEQMDLLVSLYQDEAGWLAVRRFDGEADRERLCADIGRDVALALAARSQRLGLRRRKAR
jgi:thymidylate kinase